LDDYQSNELRWNRYVRLYPVVPCSKDIRLQKGKNVLAVRCRHPKKARSYVDVGLYTSSDDVDVQSMLSKITKREPRNVNLHTALALRFVEQQRWKDAALQFRTSARIADEPTVPKWMWAALMYRQSGDLKAYHELVTEIIERCEQEDSTERLGRLAKACLLAKPTAENLPKLIEMADRVLQLDPHNTSAHVAKALAAYWSNDFDGAIHWAQKCGDDSRQALCVRALAYAQLGRLELPRKELPQLLAAGSELHIQVSFKQKDATHEAVFLKILIEEVVSACSPSSPLRPSNSQFLSHNAFAWPNSRL
jgi:tetratricopeptide (TPR) repeat protein